VTRIDKYEPLTGGHRAILGFTPVTGDLEKIIGVGLDANGRVVKGAGNTGLIGVLVPLTMLRNQGEAVDILQDGDLVECPGLVAGTRYYITADGATVNTTNTNIPLGWTVEADRLVVRFRRA
jgi:hypothetical protein